ncbi:sulfotransferase family protein [Longimicrobium sp.]|uniref:sulfotransferase family protein n=1 Tax=Longimicrobium sp. TaxID=2029185 RepID=UPI003B3BA03C
MESTVRVHPVADPAVRASRLLAPHEDGQVNPYALPVRGWAVAREPAVALEVAHGSAVVQSLPLAQRSMEAATQAGAALAPPARALLQGRVFAARGLSRLGWEVERSAGAVRRILRPDVLYSGFSGSIPLLGLPARCTLRLSLRLAGGEAAALADVSIDRPPVRVTQPARYQPLMVTSVGRSGSTWFQHLLSQHPAVAAFRAHSYEATPARELLLLAANSAASGPYTEAFFARKGFRSLLTGPSAGDAMPRMMAAVGEGVREQAEAAVRAIDRFYDLADRMDGRPAAGDEGTRYFTEKNLRPEWLFWEVYPRAKEIFLVRDFRDVITSSLAANAKWGKRFFGRGQAADDRDYVFVRAAMARPWILEPWRQRSDRAHLVRYEELILNPEPVLRGVLEYLELDPSDAAIAQMLRLAGATQAGDARSEHMTSSSAAASIGRWKKDLPPPLVAACDEAFAEFFDAFYPAGTAGT